MARLVSGGGTGKATFNCNSHSRVHNIVVVIAVVVVVVAVDTFPVPAVCASIAFATIILRKLR